ncbi:DUF222 domain-containing protein [Cryobacterium glaciale]|uniref:DUF222 domain-containing protein n=1 Tax=Cryobacterium glaciale TaxID=1259145 RepID=A0A4R8V5A2_9MICO|nr:DUF222 domain-containing protein [Cryobacterium glaciale]TFB76307.1 DUF222 domain-containing protein [Cryobacterium glaciale]
MFMENPGQISSNPVIVAVEQAREILLAALGGVSFGSLGDEESLRVLLALESVGRVVDGARALSTTDVLRRSEYLDASVAKNAAMKTAEQTEVAAAGAVSLARRLGCRSGVDLVCTLARLSRAEVRQRAALGEKAGQRMLLGRPLTPTYPVLGDALQGGCLGLEQARVIVKVLDGLRSSVLIEDLDRVERSLVASGSGAITPETEGLPGAGIAFAPELLRQQGIQWQARLAPDGTAPGETPAERRSWLTFGNLSNGGYSLNGWFTTLDRAIIGNVFDAYLSAAAASENAVEIDADADADADESIQSDPLSPCPQQPAAPSSTTPPKPGAPPATTAPPPPPNNPTGTNRPTSAERLRPR